MYVDFKTLAEGDKIFCVKGRSYSHVKVGKVYEITYLDNTLCIEYSKGFGFALTHTLSIGDFIKLNKLLEILVSEGDKC